MNREALSRLKWAHQSGASHTEIAQLYDLLKKQIEEAAGGSWRANRWECVEGSIVFVGEIHVLVIATTGIFVGKINGLVTLTGGTMKDGRYLFGPPNFEAATEKLC